LLAELLASPRARLYHERLAQLGPVHVSRLQAAGVLQELPPLEVLGACDCDGDGCERYVFRAGAKILAMCPRNAEEPIEIGPERLVNFAFNEQAWLHLFCRANGIEGTMREDARLFDYLGDRVARTHRSPVVLVRKLRRDDASMLPHLLASKYPGASCVVLFPKAQRMDERDLALLTVGGHAAINLSEAFAARAGLGMEIEWPVLPGTAKSGAPVPEPRLVIRRDRGVAELDGVELPLQSKSFQLLSFMAENASYQYLPVPTSQIFEAVWAKENAGDVEYFEAQVNDHVSKIRTAFRTVAKLPPEAARKLLANEKKKGYVLRLTPDEIAGV
jgi:DNA-binding winged helix-turn-helix (wHTH) protein